MQSFGICVGKSMLSKSGSTSEGHTERLSVPRSHLVEWTATHE
jgi:hypothetical protein